MRCEERNGPLESDDLSEPKPGAASGFPEGFWTDEWTDERREKWLMKWIEAVVREKNIERRI